MKRLLKIVRLTIGLASIGAGLSLAASPITASADYDYTRAAFWYQNGYTQHDQYFWESPPNGRPWYSEVQWSSNTYTNYFSTWLEFDGQSNAYWWGVSPWCADSITLVDQFWVTGVAISVNVPPGVGISVYNDVASYNSSNAVCNNYFDRVQHNYTGFDFNGFDLYTFTQKDCGYFTFSWQSNPRCTNQSWDWINP